MFSARLKESSQSKLHKINLCWKYLRPLLKLSVRAWSTLFCKSLTDANLLASFKCGMWGKRSIKTFVLLNIYLVHISHPVLKTTCFPYRDYKLDCCFVSTLRILCWKTQVQGCSWRKTRKLRIGENDDEEQTRVLPNSNKLVEKAVEWRWGEKRA